MHVLPRPHLPRAVMITTIAAAVLAIVLTVFLASAISDLHSSSPRLSVPSVPSVGVAWVHHPSVATGAWNRDPFAPLVRAPVVSPRMEDSPFLVG